MIIMKNAKPIKTWVARMMIEGAQSALFFALDICADRHM
jgi:hypothetical protein